MSATTTTTTSTETTVMTGAVKASTITEENMVKAGVTGAVLGFLFGGPLLSALIGFTAAYASQKDDTVGGYARSLGDFGVNVKDKALELDAKHHVSDKTTKVATEAWTKAKEYDSSYNVMEKTRDMAVYGWQWLVTFVQEHNLLQRGVDTAGTGYEYVAEKVTGSKQKQETTCTKKEQ